MFGCVWARWSGGVARGAVSVALLSACGGADFTTAAGSGGASGAGHGAGTAGNGGTDGGGSTGGSGGSTGGNASGGSSGAGPVDRSCAEYVSAYCDWAERCTDYLYGGSVDECESLMDVTCAWLELPGSGWTDAAYGACVSAYSSSDCGAASRCEEPSGTRGNGFECAAQWQCESGYCDQSSGSCGVCAPNPRHAVGGECDNPLADCEAGLECFEGKCAPRHTEGESCDDGHYCTSKALPEGYLACVEGTCTVVGRVGEPCVEASDSATFCGVGAGCGPDGICVELIAGAAGDACGPFADRYVDCPSGACVSDEDDATPRCMDWAGAGEDCHKVPGFERCAAGLTCMSSRCVWPEVAGPPADCGR